MSLSSSVITYTLIWLITCSLSHQKMAQSTTLPLLAFFPMCILGYWRFPGDTHAPSHPYNVKEYVMRVIRPPSSTAPGCSSDAHVSVVGTFSTRKQVPASSKGVSSQLCSCRCLLTPFYIFSDASYCVSSLHCSWASMNLCCPSPAHHYYYFPLRCQWSDFLGVFFFFNKKK